jgi:hypothetical protein
MIILILCLFSQTPLDFIDVRPQSTYEIVHVDGPWSICANTATEVRAISYDVDNAVIWCWSTFGETNKFNSNSATWSYSSMTIKEIDQKPAVLLIVFKAYYFKHLKSNKKTS